MYVYESTFSIQAAIIYQSYFAGCAGFIADLING